MPPLPPTVQRATAMLSRMQQYQKRQRFARRPGNPEFARFVSQYRFGITPVNAGRFLMLANSMARSSMVSPAERAVITGRMNAVRGRRFGLPSIRPLTAWTRRQR